MNDLDVEHGRFLHEGRPVIAISDPPEKILRQAAEDLGSHGLYRSLDHRLVKQSEDRTRLVEITKGRLFVELIAASIYLHVKPPAKSTSTTSQRKLKDGSIVETRRSTKTEKGVAVETTVKTKVPKKDSDADASPAETSVTTATPTNDRDSRENDPVVETTTKRKDVDDRTLVEDQPPRWLIDALDGRGEHPELREVRGVRQYPFGRRDGTLVTEAGYDAQSAYILAPNRRLVLPPDLSRAAAQRYAAELLDVVADFPLSPEGRAAWLALLLTIVMRPATGTAPLFGIDASVRGSGKGLLAKVSSIIASGVAPAIVPFRGREEEQEKTFVSALRCGASVVLLDNADGPVGGATLDAVLTAESDVLLRPLGSSVIERVSTETTLIVTGNGLSFLGDTNRRVLPLRLEPDRERPEERDDFQEPNLIVAVRKDAAALNTKVLAILESFRLAGRPKSDAAAWGSFEPWCHLVPMPFS
jgi:hypothetical protein